MHGLCMKMTGIVNVTVRRLEVRHSVSYCGSCNYRVDIIFTELPASSVLHMEGTAHDEIRRMLAPVSASFYSIGAQTYTPSSSQQVKLVTLPAILHSRVCSWEEEVKRKESQITNDRKGRRNGCLPGLLKL